MIESSADSEPPSRQSPVHVSVLIDTDEGLTNEQAVAHHWIPDAMEFAEWTKLALSSLHNEDLHYTEVEVSVKLVTSDNMQSLNNEYRNKLQPTNVLSFPSGMPSLVMDDKATESLRVLGDLVLCPSVIALEAKSHGKNLHDHWAHLTVHGVLHLCGFDHEHADDANAMESAEIQILSRLGINNPYLTTAQQLDE